MKFHYIFYSFLQMEDHMSPVIFLNGLVALTFAVGVGASISEAKGPVRASADIYDCVNTDIQLGTAQLKEEKTEEGAG